jgi:hypothetical protein
MTIDVLHLLAGNPDPAISARAQYALQLTEAVNTNQISADEYQELCRDLARMDALDRECADLELKTALVMAVYAVAKLS